MNSTPTPKPGGIEAAVCEDIARRQQLGKAKYGVTVADNPLSLLAWLRHAYEESLDFPIYLRRCIADLEATTAPAQPQAAAPSAPAPRTPTKPPVQGRTMGRYQINGKPMRIQDLADLAGCSWATMQQRLRRRTAEEAVAMGGPGQQGVQRTAAAVHASAAKAARHPYYDQMLTVAELAALAGCTAKQMHLRLRHGSPERAVALGTAGPPGRRRRDVDEATATAETPHRTNAHTQSPASAASSPAGVARRQPQAPRLPAPSLNRTAEVIVPANVKRTVAPPIPDRFAAGNAPAHFSARRPGQYDADADQSALARAIESRQP